MSEPFLAEIKIVGFNFAPRGWALCDGQILPINQNQALFSLLGTVYGGDGRTSFALPDLRSRVPIHVGNSHTQGQRGGAENVTLTAAEIPGHSHQLAGSSSTANTPDPTNNLFGAASANVYNNVAQAPRVPLDSGALQNTGASQGHNNMQPFLTVHFCIALQGVFPSRN